MCAKRNVDYQVSVYGRFLVDYLIREIKNSTDDPIHTVQGFYSYLDWILGDSDDDHFETHRFAARMDYETGNILRYLKDMEREGVSPTKERNEEDAKSELERNRG